MTGTLYGIGVGPGDSDLLTLKGKQILDAAPVIAYLAPETGDSMARTIAAPHIPEGRTEIVMRTVMVPGDAPAEAVYDEGAAAIAAHLDGGRDVAVLCEGDPLFFGSFMYLHERLAERYPTEVIPGVSSIMACAAAAGMPLVTRNEVFTVVPATLPEDELAARIKASQAVAVMKVGRHMAKLKGVLGGMGLANVARYVARTGLADEVVLPFAEAPERAPYFSMVLVRPADARTQSVDAPEGAALVALSPRGAALARWLQPHLPDSQVQERGVDFSDTMAHLRDLFRAGTPIVGICAAGILVRAVAPLLADKRAEPPVVALSEDGRSAVPLLGGHRGGNRLARTLASVTGGLPAVTTAGDVSLGLALDDPPRGWTVANPETAKGITAALLAGDPVGLAVEAGDAAWITDSAAAFSEDASPAVRVTDQSVAEVDQDLVLHPPSLALGVGCERGTEPRTLIAHVTETLAANGLAPSAVACVVSVDLKADEDAVHALAQHLGVSARFFPAEVLEAETPRLAHPSGVVFAEVGCHGVAEGAALAAVGAEGELVVEKTKAPRVTCAVARAPGNIDAESVGTARGRLFVVGVGPGTDDWRAPEATAALMASTDVVGYKLYLDLVAHLTAGKRLHHSAMTQEEARVRMALDLATGGRTVSLVCSGDAGIYALAALTFELLDREDRGDWNRLDIQVVPGISAFQAAGARIGAPFGHDFCLVSLSDLLTPWEEIERRLHAAAEGDFVVAFYNPVSKRRRTQLAAAKAALLAHRPPETPVILARNLGRPEETVDVITLDALTPDHADMLTLVVVGNRQTRVIERGTRRWVYTPRGYAKKMGSST